jgi:hypothetical protein
MEEVLMAYLTESIMGIINAMVPVDNSQRNAHAKWAYPTLNGRITLECDGDGVPIMATKFDARGRIVNHWINVERLRAERDRELGWESANS